MSPPDPQSPSQPDAAASFATSVFHHPLYLRHNARRQEHLATLGLDLRDKSVLEVGAGIADHTTFFLDRNCKVVSIEPREENCANFCYAIEQMATHGYDKAFQVQLIQCDVEMMDRYLQQQFDVVYCYGLLYHVADPLAVLQLMSRCCLDLLLLETCVSYGGAESVNPADEVTEDPSQAVRGIGCRPTRPWIFNRLKEQFAHVYVPRSQPAHDEFPLDWTVPPPAQGRLTRAVFIASRRALDNPALLTHLPDRQEPCA